MDVRGACSIFNNDKAGPDTGFGVLVTKPNEKDGPEEARIPIRNIVEKHLMLLISLFSRYLLSTNDYLIFDNRVECADHDPKIRSTYKISPRSELVSNQKKLNFKFPFYYFLYPKSKLLIVFAKNEALPF